MIKVIGDIMLDRWIHGNANRLSPESPVPVLLETHQSSNLGGAANVSVNLAGLELRSELYGAISEDREGVDFLRLLYEHPCIDPQIVRNHSVTTTKTRLVSQSGQHIMRWDREEKYLGRQAKDKLFFGKSKTDLLIISDYNKGMVNSSIIDWANEKGIKTFVDPKQSPEVYRNAWLVKPNLKEYEEWDGKFDPNKASNLCRKHNWEWIIVTCGAEGLYAIHREGDSWHYKEEVREVADVTGAGDCVMAVLVWGFIQGMTIPEAADSACYAAARNVEHRGVVPVSLKDVKKETVFTNGCFDIIHFGHMHLLKSAKQLGKRLIVGINSDASVKKLKGLNRPINNQDIRLAQVKALPYVDEAYIFEEDTPYELIKKIKPDVIVKGGDYNEDNVVGRDLARVEIIPLIEGFSTTKIIESMKNENTSNGT